MAENATSGAAFAALKAHVDAVKSRYREVEALFEGFPITPLKAVDCKKFLEDHFSLLAMRYVTMGEFALDGRENSTRETSMHQQGFTVSGQGKPLEPALHSPAIQAALAAGLDLDRDPEDDGDIPAKG